MAQSSVVRSGIARLFIVGLVAVLATVGLLAAVPAHAEAPSSGEPPVTDPHAPGRSTEATIVDFRLTSGLYGGTVPSAQAQTPYPTTGLQNPRSVTTAQIVLDDPGTSGTTDLYTYCIDLNTETTLGTHYDLGEWTEANVPHLPYVQWILENYFPQQPAAPALANDTERVRAVQGAIWYFTDQFVVSRAYPTERAQVRAIVEAAQAALAGGIPPTPGLPTLTVTPSSYTGSLPGDILGPFAVGGTVPTSTIDILPGSAVFRDAAGTVPVNQGDTIATGDQLWARYDPDISPEGFTLEATAQVPAGNVFLYDGNNPPRTTAQKLVLAQLAPVTLRASAEVLPPPAGTGTLAVDLVIDGAAAGEQGQIDLLATCTDGSADPLVVPLSQAARTPAGTVTTTVPFLPAGATCVVTQTADGSTPFVTVTSVVGPGVTIAAGSTSTITVTDTYAFPVPATGSLQVSLTTNGAAAADRGDIELIATCTAGSGTGAFAREIVVPAGPVSTNQPVATIAALPAGAICQVDQTEGGSNDRAVLALTVIAPASVTIASGSTAGILVTDTYDAPVVPTGSLRIDATIGGAAAGAQSAIGLRVTCTLDGDTVQDVTVPAGATGTVAAATLAGIPVESRCALSQTADGANARATLTSSTIAPSSVEITDAATAVLAVSDVYAVPTPPSPSPTPTGSALPVTGAPSADGPLWAAGLVLLAGLVALGIDTLRRRRRRA